MQRLGAALPLQNLSPPQQVAYMQRAETSGYDSAWVPEVLGTDDLEAARQWMRRELTGYAIVDAYHAYFTACGFGTDSTACREAWQQGDRAGATQCISDAMVHAMAAIGSPEACRAQLATFAEAGVTLPVVFPFSYEADPVPSVMRTLQTIPTA
jgi:alkanesulfonate monooxygenase SsuD/methylene tetrahydromethanopterin reductase-like flavin-dependent oxidoreductase (luciferase family)